jgi:hypothetical protein
MPCRKKACLTISTKDNKANGRPIQTCRRWDARNPNVAANTIDVYKTKRKQQNEIRRGKEGPVDESEMRCADRHLVQQRARLRVAYLRIVVSIAHGFEENDILALIDLDDVVKGEPHRCAVRQHS